MLFRRVSFSSRRAYAPFVLSTWIEFYIFAQNMNKFFKLNFILGSFITTVIFSIAITSFFWTPFPTDEININLKLKSPDKFFWLGTDHFGRDILSMLMVGARNSIIVSITGILIGSCVGTLLGIIAAAYRGILENIIMRLSDLTFAFPSLLVAI